MKRLSLFLALLGLCSTFTRTEAAATPASSFHGTVYQVDTIYNFVDVIMLGGTRRFYADDASIVHVHRHAAKLIDISMGEEVRGTYRVDPKGARIVVKIDDLTAN